MSPLINSNKFSSKRFINNLFPYALDEEYRKIRNILYEFDEQKHKNLSTKIRYAQRLPEYLKSKLEELKANIDYSIENQNLTTFLSIISVIASTLLPGWFKVIALALSILSIITLSNRSQKNSLLHVIKLALAYKINN